MSQTDFALSRILRTKIIPWVEVGIVDKVVIGTPQMPAVATLPNIRFTPCHLTGPRVPSKNGNQYDGKRWITARWPQDALNEVLQPRLIYVLSGRMKFQVCDYLIECNAGHLLLIPPGVPHSNGARTCAAKGSANCELLYLLPYPNSLQCWMDRFNETSNAIVPIGNFMFLDERLTSTYRLMMEEILEQNNASSPVAISLLNAFWYQFQRLVEKNDFLHVNFSDTNYADRLAVHAPADAGEQDFTTTLRNYIYAHIHETITIDDMAKKMYRSRPQFTRTVRRETGLSFVEFLTRCRIEEAKRLLCETSWGIATVAKTVGIKPSYFSTVFFQHTGLKPSIFREQKKMTQN